MQLIRPGTKINFLKWKYHWMAISAAVILAGLMSVAARQGLNYGVDFAGGAAVQVKFSKPVSVEAVRSSIVSVDAAASTIQHFGSKDEVLIRVPQEEAGLEAVQEKLSKDFEASFGKGAFEVRRVEMVGPKAGKDLQRKAFLAIVYSMIGMVVYITLRFEFKFAIAAMIAIVHDVTISVGFLSLMNLEYNLTMLAALLTIVGYSINDTIVVYDRIRENLKKHRREDYGAVINRSINETLSRTFLTGLTTLIVLIILAFLGGEVIRDFALILFVGIIVGTYSSIFIASPVVVLWHGFARPRAKVKVAAVKKRGKVF